MHGVDADGESLGGKPFDDRDNPSDLDIRIDADGTGTGGLTTDVDDRRAVGCQCQAVLHCAIRIEVPSAVGEGVVGDVDDAYHDGAHHDGAHHLRAGLRRHLRRIRPSASDRDASLDLNRPRTAEVVVIAPAFRTPRMAMQRCSASITTITPRGLSLRCTASAT